MRTPSSVAPSPKVPASVARRTGRRGARGGLLGLVLGCAAVVATLAAGFARDAVAADAPGARGNCRGFYTLPAVSRATGPPDSGHSRSC